MYMNIHKTYVSIVYEIFEKEKETEKLIHKIIYFVKSYTEVFPT